MSKKSDFINSYIIMLEETIQQYNSSIIDEDALFDCIQQIRGVLGSEIPEIDDAIQLKKGTTVRDAKSIIGVLKLWIINNSKSSKTDSEQFSKDLCKLDLEYDGIKDVILLYSSDGNITNYVNKLGIAIKNVDIEKIKYCLKAIGQWYNKNINAIHKNPYVINVASHDDNRIKVQEFITAFEKYDGKSMDLNTKVQSITKPIIFLSHKSDDKKYGDALEEFICGLGVRNDQLIYTSHPLHKIPLDENIYEYLRKSIANNMLMIILWSNTYLSSPACLNEMGAAWVAKSDYTNIYVPSFAFENPKYRECVVDTSKMGTVLNGDDKCKVSMVELKNKIQKAFELNDDEKTSMLIIDRFINRIKEIQNDDRKA